MRFTLLVLLGITCSSFGFELRLCTNSLPSKTCVRTVADSTYCFRKYNVKRVDVGITNESDFFMVDTRIMCNRGFRTSGSGRGETLKKACDNSCLSVVKYMKKKHKHRPRDKLPEQCYFIRNLR